MKSGFKDVVDRILRSYGLRTGDCIGAVMSNGEWSWKALTSMGYRVEYGIDKPDYDYVVLSKAKSTLDNILKALTVIKNGCIIIFRVDDQIMLIQLLKDLNKLNCGLNFTMYSYGEDKTLGVLFKGKEF